MLSFTFVDWCPTGFFWERSAAMRAASLVPVLAGPAFTVWEPAVRLQKTGEDAAERGFGAGPSETLPDAGPARSVVVPVGRISQGENLEENLPEPPRTFRGEADRPRWAKNPASYKSSPGIAARGLFSTFPHRPLHSHGKLQHLTEPFASSPRENKRNRSIQRRSLSLGPVTIRGSRLVINVLFILNLLSRSVYVAHKP